jgi:sortase A
MVAKKTRQLIGALLLSIFLTASCEASKKSEPIATGTLPQPIPQITHAAPSVIANAPSPTAIANTPIPRSDVAQLADDLFGATRLIEKIFIPAIHIESAVTPVGWRVNFSTELQSGEFEWDSPGADVGWVVTSALPDEIGNVVLYGHNNTYEKVFKNLADLQLGDKIFIQTSGKRWEYEVRQVVILQIVGASAEQLKGYQKYLQPTQDARVTLISCWPPISNTHRVAVIAKPVAP